MLAEGGGLHLPEAAMEQHMIACVQESLGSFLLENACFMAERLAAEFPSEANMRLLATCYMRSDQAYRAFAFLRGCDQPDSRYLFALCCIQLGKLTEAEHALNPTNDGREVPKGAAGFFLLGKICRLTNRHRAGVAYHRAALSIDPLLWCAYEELCVLGAEEDATLLLSNEQASLRAGLGATAGAAGAAHQTPLMQHNGNVRPPLPTYNTGLSSMQVDGATPMQQDASGIALATPSPSSFTTPSIAEAPAGPPAMPNRHAVQQQQQQQGRQQQQARHHPSTEMVAAHRGAVGAPMHLEHAPASNGGAWPAGLGLTPAATPALHAQAPGGNGRRFKFTDDNGKMRKVSGRLFNDPPTGLRRSSRQAGTAMQDAGQKARGPRQEREEALQLQRHADSGATTSGASLGLKTSAGHAAVLGLIQTLGEGFCMLCMYRCQEAIEAFNRLQPGQYATGWVLCQVGRAHFEMVDYPAAARTFEWARQVDPCRLEGMEVYSTVLWHLKQEKGLAHLAQDCIAMDRRSPFAWAVTGNCLSLQKEHESALKAFQRALQLEPTLTYTYTLAGHEYFANEDFDQAMTCYRNAIRMDPRHYNAWYGVGQIYFRQEKYEMAEYQFKRALHINPRSSVLRCYLGMALHKIGRPSAALEQLQAAIDADPKNPLAKFEKAAVLMSQDQYAAAGAELEALKDFAPKEASVWFQLGKVYKKLDDPDQALRHFCHALDLKPSSADVNLIKSAIEKLRLTESSDDEEI